jgi:DNA-binding transcriptional ArsR family regulator
MSESAASSGQGRAVPVLDVVVMRALAHPARLALLEHLGQDGPATATECADVVGLSPSAVSYHLRALARAGLVEAAPGRGDGRERLWRRTAERYEVADGHPESPEMREARQEFLRSLLAWDDTRARRYLERVDDEPKEWQHAALFANTTLLVTAQELERLGESVEELLAPFRRGSRQDIPAGARTVSMMIRALPSQGFSPRPLGAPSRAPSQGSQRVLPRRPGRLATAIRERHTSKYVFHIFWMDGCVPGLGGQGSLVVRRLARRHLAGAGIAGSGDGRVRRCRGADRRGAATDGAGPLDRPPG